MIDIDLLYGAMKELDGAFGADFAQAHPEVVVGYMQAAATLAVANALTQQYNPQAEALHTIAVEVSSALESLATAIKEKE